MIAAVRRDEGVALTLDLPPGSVAYVDADWLPRSGFGPVVALVLSPDGSFQFGDGAPVALPSDLDPDVAAGLALEAVAEEARAAVAGLPGHGVDVTGRGYIASAVRRLVGDDHVGLPREQPLAIIETTGEREAIVEASRRVATLGCIVLAGETPASPPIDLYPDLHARSLTLMGIGRPLSGDAPPWAALRGRARRPALLLEEPTPVAERSVLPRSRAWFRVARTTDSARPQDP
jgi:hypothetical protein